MRGQPIRKRAGSCLIVAAGIVSACDRGRLPDGQEVASLHLTCAPASRGVRCELLALSRDVSHFPRDVTPNASWRLSGTVGAQMSPDGVIDAPADGDVAIEAQYATQRVQAQIRLMRNRPGQVLATVRGQVYAEAKGMLRPMPHVRVEVVGGPNAGLSTMTTEDGSYEFVRVVPGDVVVRAAKIGYSAGDNSTYLHPGDNRLSILIEALLPPTVASSL
jgi:hypothetical protein